MKTVNIDIDMDDLDLIISMLDGESKMRDEMLIEIIRDEFSTMADVESLRESRDRLIILERKLKAIYGKHK
jgi:hypothetical protein